jgi:hypothetical protein
VNIVALQCEQCGGHHLRRANLRGFGEALKACLGIYPFRCRSCQHRFLVSVWFISRLAYAKCPKCLGLELTTWSRKHYNPGLLGNLAITFGAQKYRCVPCRCNFVSFRPKRNPDAAKPQTGEKASGGVPQQAVT